MIYAEDAAMARDLIQELIEPCQQQSLQFADLMQVKTIVKKIFQSHY